MTSKSELEQEVKALRERCDELERLAARRTYQVKSLFALAENMHRDLVYLSKKHTLASHKMESDNGVEAGFILAEMGGFLKRIVRHYGYDTSKGCIGMYSVAYGFRRGDLGWEEDDGPKDEGDGS